MSDRTLNHVTTIADTAKSACVRLEVSAEAVESVCKNTSMLVLERKGQEEDEQTQKTYQHGSALMLCSDASFISSPPGSNLHRESQVEIANLSFTKRLYRDRDLRLSSKNYIAFILTSTEGPYHHIW